MTAPTALLLLILACALAAAVRHRARCRPVPGLAGRVVDALGVVVWAVDRGHIVRLSEGGALRKLGLEPGELVGRPVADVAQRGNAVEGPGTDERDIIARVIATGRGCTQTNRHASPDGHVRYLRTEYAPLFDEEGRVEYVAGCSVDVTTEETRALQTERQALRAAASRLSQRHDPR